jgi:hypothetical protein
MRFARSKFFLLSFFWVSAFFAVVAFAIEEKPWAEQFTNELQGIKTRLTAVEQKQADILAEKGKILEELDRLGVWVKHSGSKKQK